MYDFSSGGADGESEVITSSAFRAQSSAKRKSLITVSFILYMCDSVNTTANMYVILYGIHVRRTCIRV